MTTLVQKMLPCWCCGASEGCQMTLLSQDWHQNPGQPYTSRGDVLCSPTTDRHFGGGNEGNLGTLVELK